MASSGCVAVIRRILKLYFWLVNNRPRVSKTGRYLDQLNATVKLFQADRGADVLVHVKTFAHGEILTPNKPAATGDGGFVVANDHSYSGESVDALVEEN